MGARADNDVAYYGRDVVVASDDAHAAAVVLEHVRQLVSRHDLRVAMYCKAEIHVQKSQVAVHMQIEDDELTLELGRGPTQVPGQFRVAGHADGDNAVDDAVEVDDDGDAKAVVDDGMGGYGTLEVDNEVADVAGVY